MVLAASPRNVRPCEVPEAAEQPDHDQHDDGPEEENREQYQSRDRQGQHRPIPAHDHEIVAVAGLDLAFDPGEKGFEHRSDIRLPFAVPRGLFLFFRATAIGRSVIDSRGTGVACLDSSRVSFAPCRRRATGGFTLP